MDHGVSRLVEDFFPSDRKCLGKRWKTINTGDVE